jgi:hypothetical protein
MLKRLFTVKLWHRQLLHYAVKLYNLLSNGYQELRCLLYVSVIIYKKNYSVKELIKEHLLWGWIILVLEEYAIMPMI